MLRITTIRTAAPETTLHLEGQIAGAWTLELERTCYEELKEDRSVILNLAEVTMIDREGLALLVELAWRGIELRQCSPFQEEQLRLATATQRKNPTPSLP